MRGPLASPAITQVVLAAIDGRTVARYGPLPLNRGTLAEGLELLAQAHPRVLVLDLLIAEPGDPQSDERLARAVHQFPKVVLGAALDSDPEEKPRWILPLPHLAAGNSVGHVHAAPDADGSDRFASRPKRRTAGGWPFTTQARKASSPA